MTETKNVQLGIKEVEEMVGKKASHIEVRQRDIVLTFGGGIIPGGSCSHGPHDGGPAADVHWRVKKW